MNVAISRLVKRLEAAALSGTNIIPWSCPVPAFGDHTLARVATLGLNPSNREFIDSRGRELDGQSRRFHTLNSLGLARWNDADQRHLNLISEACRAYFTRNPYDSWFKRLDYIISGTCTSYYGASSRACHLDLIPYATACKWTELSRKQRIALLEIASDTLALLLSESQVRLLILNGNSVVDHFQKIAKISLSRQPMTEWSLPRRSNNNVIGIAYRGNIKCLSGIKLKHDILVLGFNHNIQSSFGVTRKVTTEIQKWICRSAHAEGVL